MKFLATLLLFISTSVEAKTEDEYNRAWCPTVDGGTEYILLDRTRVDCITDTHAWEMDFAAKWYEGLGQSLHYARITGLKPGLVLILKTDRDYRHVVAALKVIAHWELPIDVEVVR